jgi:hypothetical protein
MSKGKLRVKELKQDMVMIHVDWSSVLPNLRYLLAEKFLSGHIQKKLKIIPWIFSKYPLIPYLK